jgi:hypothetical protein
MALQRNDSGAKGFATGFFVDQSIIISLSLVVIIVENHLDFDYDFISATHV